MVTTHSLTHSLTHSAQFGMKTNGDKAKGFIEKKTGIKVQQGDDVYSAIEDEEGMNDLHKAFKNASSTGRAFIIVGLASEGFLNLLKMLASLGGTVISAVVSSKGIDLSDPKDTDIKLHDGNEDHVIVEIKKKYKGGKAN